jgi:lambda repressor-like predicted transcriptional regulator
MNVRNIPETPNPDMFRIQNLYAVMRKTGIDLHSLAQEFGVSKNTVSAALAFPESFPVVIIELDAFIAKHLSETA